MNRRLNICRALTLGIGLSPVFALSAVVQSQQPAQQAVPDSPAPQAPKPLSDEKNQVTPGIGANGSSTPSNAPSTSTPPDDNFQPAPATPGSNQPANPNAPDTIQGAAPELPAAGAGVDAVSTTIRVTTNAVEVPVLVKDSKGNMVAGLDWRDFRVYENNVRQRITVFTVDPSPLSISYVIDQSVTSDVMNQVNISLGSVQASLAPYDEVAVFTYNHGAQEATGFTGSQSHRLEAVLAMTHATGQDMLVPVTSGPLAGCPISSNGACVDPNIQPGHSAGGDFLQLPKELHTLNDAILKAAEELSRRPIGRRRIIYVISDGKEAGSKASTKEVIRFLQANKIAVYGTLVGDSARWGEGYLNKFHVPFEMNNNVLLKYATETGGQLDAERNANGIVKSYGKLATEARNQYTIVYNSHQPFIDGKYRSIEVRVDRPNVDVTAKRGYIPTAADQR